MLGQQPLTSTASKGEAEVLVVATKIGINFGMMERFGPTLTLSYLCKRTANQ